MNTSNSSDASNYEETDGGRLNLYYTVCEVLVAIFAVVGNAMVILVFRKERRLRRRTNYYIVSLAAADLLVGLLGIPFAIMASVGLPSNLYACLFTVSLLVVLCTISIFCLVAVSVDRYWAILHPMGYSRNVRTKTALVIIGICWFAGSVIGFLPLMGWYNAARTREGECYFLDVVDMNYLVFLYFGTIITPALVLAAFYAHIYQVVLKQLRQIVTISPTHGTSSAGRSTSGGTMLRMLGAAQKREVKATQNLSIIVLFFMICWIPLYTINCVIAFCDKCQINSTFMSMCIILSHANSAGNPLLYAYHLKDFREALKNFLCDLFGYTNNSRSMSYNNTFAHSRLNSLRESRTYNFSQKKYIESPVYFNRTTKSMSLPTSPKLISIVPKSVALAAATAVDRTDIWRISEVASNVDDHSNNDSSGIHTRPSTPFIKRNSSSSSLKNCSYLNDINYDEDDDVFLDDTLPITDFTCDGVEFQNNLGDGFDKFCEAPALAELKMQSGSCLSSSSPQLSRNLFLVETELNDYKSIRCNSTTDKNEGKRRNGQAGEYICSPSRSIKSPLKVMGEILWNATKYPKSASLSDESNVSPKYRRKNNGSVYTQDNHSFHC